MICRPPTPRRRAEHMAKCNAVVLLAVNLGNGSGNDVCVRPFDEAH